MTTSRRWTTLFLGAIVEGAAASSPSPPAAPPSTPPMCWMFVTDQGSCYGESQGFETAGDSWQSAQHCMAYCDTISTCVSMAYQNNPVTGFKRCVRYSTDCTENTIRPDDYFVTYRRGLCTPPSSPPSTPPSTPPISSSSGDPHLHFAHGGKADFRGKHGATYAMLSAPNITFSMTTHDADFLLPRPTLVHGSFFTHAYWTLRSRITGNILRISARADRPGFTVRQADGRIAESHENIWQEETLSTDVRVYSKQSTIFVRAAGWETNVTRNPVYNAIKTVFPWRYDVTMRPLRGTSFAARHGVGDFGHVAPHGLIGQSYDDDSVAVDGAMDAYRGKVEVTTSAMAEGAIEGVAADYELETPFETHFLYGRFDNKRWTPPRNVKALTGEKRVRGVSKKDGEDADGVAGATMDME